MLPMASCHVIVKLLQVNDAGVVDDGDGSSRQILRIVDTSYFMAPQLKQVILVVAMLVRCTQ